LNTLVVFFDYQEKNIKFISSNLKNIDLISRAILFLFLICCITSKLTLQAKAVNNQIKDVVMPSANAASLGKYGDIPVSLHTGVPNVGIPIYTVQNGSLSMPITLSYHAGGLKVGEPCSWVHGSSDPTSFDDVIIFDIISVSTKLIRNKISYNSLIIN
jgi:hypothetical protein